MAAKPSTHSAGDPRQRAEALLLEGKKDQAAEEYARGGAYEQAIELAVEARNEAKAVEYSLLAGLGRIPAGYTEAGVLQAAELLVEQGCHKVAIPLFELSHQYRRAAESALQLDQVSRAARFFERAKSWAEAAEHYERAGMWNDALRALEHEESHQRRGEILARLGLNRDAAEAYEVAGDWPRAAARWEDAKDPVRAGQAYARAGQSKEAARCFLAAGRPQLAATAFAQAGDHAAAAANFLKAGQLLDAGAELLAAGDKAQAARTLIQLAPGAAGYREATLLLAPLLVEEGLLEEALRRLAGLPNEARGAAGAANARERRYWQGRAHQGLGQLDQARELYRQVAAEKADHRDVGKRLAELDGTRVRGAYDTVNVSSRRETPRSEVVAVGSLLAGRYDVQAELGSGGMGRVYKAYDRELGEAVAIKALLRSAADGDEERLLREVQICRRITHPNVVRVFDLGRLADGIFITMELLEGTSLEKLIAAAGPLPLDRAKAVLLEVCEGLDEAHGLGVVHRDLKPSNIMLTATRVKILDFGTARMVGKETRLAQTGFSAGSPMYMSPEELQGLPVDARSDLYALGVVAFTMLAGKEPFQASSPSALALMHLQQTPTDLRKLRPDLPAGWPELVAKLLAKEPPQRFQAAKGVAAALEKLP